MKRVKSGKEFWFGLILWSAMLISIGTPLIMPEGKLTGFFCSVPVVAFLLWIYFDTWYEMREEYLYCSCGPFKEKIYYDKIKSVRLTRNLLSSMALSSKRIEIRQHGKGYFTGTTLISPVDREAFLGELKKHCGRLES
ncbi:hypothetical protein SDC9_61096 [bioreactor metagenome]|uniref:Uncharacterized protein YyaB-like PH domain-containing protein n=1 Tax=bioreactor metagenome TaxID=1076179 RepID=A0A644XEV3_9ZZZZ